MAEELSAEQLAAQVAAMQESISKLEANNSELKKERNKFKAEASKYNGVDIDKLQSAAQKLEKMEEDRLKQEGEYQTLHSNLQKQYETDVDKLSRQIKEARSALDTEVKVNALNNSLVAAGVDPILLNIASKSLIDDVALTEDRKAMVGGKDVRDYVKEWSETEVGKRFIPSGNTGGGAGGSNSGSVSAEAKWFDPKSPEFNRTKQGQLRKANPELADKLSKKYGK